MRAYSWQNVHVLVEGVEITGWADGDDALTLGRREDLASDKVGVDGGMVVSLSANRSGRMVMKLFQTSASNKYLNSLANLQQGGPNTFVPLALAFQDSYRQDAITGLVGYFKSLPEVKRGATANVQEWEVVVERMDILLGSPLFAGSMTALAEALGG